MRRFPVPSHLTSLALVLAASPALADTTIGSSSTANVRTSTANSGAADNVVVSSSGTIAPASGTAITIDSNNTVSNGGTIQTTDLSNIIAIGGGGGFTSAITNSGTITISESYTQTDSNSDGVVDGAFAQDSGRFGVYLTGAGAFTGNIANSGTITIKGNDSAGIASDVAITGSVTTTGTISVTGDRTYGVRLGNVSGVVAISGATSATGNGAIGVALTGDVGGAVVVHNSITATGYTSTTLPSTITSLTSENLLQGGPALAVQGNVGGGVLIATTTTSTDTTLDADGDGIADTTQGTGAVTSYGSAPAILIGNSSRAIALGLINNRTVGLAIDGSVTAAGVYAGFDATAIRIGGLGGAVSVAGGVSVAGTVSASANGANATGIVIGALATVPTLTNLGTISATVGTTSSAANARAILIETGGSLASITNSGTINGTVSLGTGQGTAILDQSGTLTSITNNGTITGADLSSTSRAIDVSANTSGFTYAQAQASGSTVVPKLTGAIVTGSGSDTLTASAGTLTSDANLGEGNNQVALSGTAAWTGSLTFGSGADSVTLADTSSFSGDINFGSGADSMTVGAGATFAGRILDTSPHVALTIAGGTVRFTTTDAVSLASLSITGTGSHLGVAIDPATGAHTLIGVAGATTIGGATTLDVALSSLNLANTTYTVLTSGTLTGSANVNAALGTLPYLLTGSVAGSDSSGSIGVTIRRKTAAELGFRRSEAAAYDAVYAAITSNSALTSLFLGLSDADATRKRYDQMLPDHAGGVFDMLSVGALRMGSGETSTPWTDLGAVSLWMQQAQISTSQKAVNTPGYHASGWNLAVGGDVSLGKLGRAGLTMGYVFGDLHNGGGDNEVTASVFQGGAYWFAHWGGLQLAADGTFGALVASSRRSIEGTTSVTPTILSTKGKWNGTMATGTAKAAYELGIGAFYLRPSVTLTYARLHEDPHTENGGGIGYDLMVDARNSDELAVLALTALGLKLGDKSGQEDSLLTRFEVEGGRRTIIGGQLGATTARFTGGSDITLLPEDRGNGYVGDVRAVVGSSAFRLTADVGTEERDGYHVVSGRVGLRGIF